MEIAREMGVSTRMAYRSGNTDGVVLPGEQAAQVFVHYDGKLCDIRDLAKMDDIKCRRFKSISLVPSSLSPSLSLTHTLSIYLCIYVSICMSVSVSL